MPTLVGTIKDSAGFGITGTLSIRLDAYTINTATNPDEVSYGKPVLFAITNGALATAQRYKDDGTLDTAAPIVLAATQTQTYTFGFNYDQSSREFYLDGGLYLGDWNQVTSGTTPPQGFYTGAVYNAATSRSLTVYQRKTPTPLFYPFSAKMPTGATIEWSSLTDSGINAENIDTSLLEIGRIVSTTFGANLAASVFIPAGDWSSSTNYAKNSVVYYTTNKTLYWKISTDTSAGLLPTNITHWQKILEAPESVGQTITLINTAPAAGTWNNNTTQAPTANVLWNYFQLLRTIATSYSKTETDNAISTALANYNAPPATTAVNQPYTDTSTKIANTQFVKDARTQWITFEETKPSGTNGGSAGGSYITRILNSRAAGEAIGDSICTSHNTATGSITLRAGRYRVNAWATVNRCNSNRIYLYNVTAGADILPGSTEFSGTNLVDSSSSNLKSVIANREFTLAAAASIQLRHYLQTPSSSTDLLGRASAAISTEIYASLTLERID
jgi:hypothetical protein